jgi:glutathione S-transferase/GST-like protein
MLALYHWEPNAESLALLICLKEMNLEFESRYVDMLELEHHAAEYLGISPKAIVPLLDSDGELMTDTGFALQYLAESHPEHGLAPTDASQLYDLQAWAAWLGGWVGIRADIQLLGWNYVMLRAVPEDRLESFRAAVAELPKEKQSGWAAVWSDAEADEDQLANAEERVRKLVQKLEAILANSSWMIGDQYSISDMLAYGYLHSLPDLLPAVVNLKETPEVMRWLGKIAERAAVRDAHAMRRSEIAETMYAAPGS